MGHERTGALPHSKPWRDIVAQLASSSATTDEIARLSNSTLQNVRSRFLNLHRDQGVVASFQFLIVLAKSASDEVARDKTHGPVVDFGKSPSVLRLVAALRAWVDEQAGSREYGDLAKKAAADAIVVWSTQQRQQVSLFVTDEEPGDIWRQMNTGAGFCEVARLFFSKFTERYLNYFLGREASAVCSSVVLRDEIEYRIREHIDGISRYAFETARITQSFAAGWFNRHAQEALPTREESQAFLSIAFNKMQEELSRDVSRRG